MRGVISLACTNLAAPLTALVVGPLLAQSHGSAGRGEYAGLVMAVTVLGVAGTYGIQDGFARFLARGRLTPNGAMRLGLRLLFPATCVTLIVGALVGKALFGSEREVYRDFPLLLAFIPVLILYNLYLGIATGIGDVVGLNGARMIPALGRAVAVAALCLTTGVSPLTAAMVLVLTPSAGIVWIAWHAARRDVRYQADERSRRPEGLIRFSLACFPGVLATLSTLRLDQVIGLPLIGARQLGLYAVAVSVAELPMVLAAAVRVVILGMGPTASMIRDQERLSRMLTSSVVFSCFAIGIGAVVLIPIVFGADYEGATVPCLLLLVATVMYSGATSLAAILLAHGASLSQSRASMLGTVLGMVALFAFKGLGASGAAVASILGYSVSLGLCYRALRKTASVSISSLFLPRMNDFSEIWKNSVLKTRLSKKMSIWC